MKDAQHESNKQKKRNKNLEEKLAASVANTLLLEERIASLEREIAKLRRQMREQEEECEEQRDWANQFKEKVQDEQARVRQLQGEVERLKSKYQKLKAEAVVSAQPAAGEEKVVPDLGDETVPSTRKGEDGADDGEGGVVSTNKVEQSETEGELASLDALTREGSWVRAKSFHDAPPLSSSSSSSSSSGSSSPVQSSSASTPPQPSEPVSVDESSLLLSPGDRLDYLSKENWGFGEVEILDEGEEGEEEEEEEEIPEAESEEMESQESDPPAAPMTEEEKLNELRKTVEIKQRENTIIIQGKRILFKILENGNIVVRQGGGFCGLPSLFETMLKERDGQLMVRAVQEALDTMMAAKSRLERRKSIRLGDAQAASELSSFRRMSLTTVEDLSPRSTTSDSASTTAVKATARVSPVGQQQQSPHASMRDSGPRRSRYSIRSGSPPEPVAALTRGSSMRNVTSTGPQTAPTEESKKGTLLRKSSSPALFPFSETPSGKRAAAAQHKTPTNTVSPPPATAAAASSSTTEMGAGSSKFQRRPSKELRPSMRRSSISVGATAHANADSTSTHHSSSTSVSEEVTASSSGGRRKSLAAVTSTALSPLLQSHQQQQQNSSRSLKSSPPQNS